MMQHLEHFLNLRMVSAPWPLSGTDLYLTTLYLDEQAKERGFEDWVEAYHKHLSE